MSNIRRVVKNSKLYCINPEKDFSRKRKLTMEKLITGIIGMQSGSLTNELIDFLKYDLLEIATANKQKSLYNKQILPIIKRIQDYLTIEQDRNSEQAKTRPPFIDVSVTKDGEICENLNTTKLVQYVRDTDIYALIKANPENQFYVYDEKTGIYTLANNQQMNGIIKKHIEDYEPKFVKTNILTEVRNQLASDLNYTELEKFNSDENIIDGIDGEQATAENHNI